MANSPLTGLLAATVWGTGVCYMWPTMLASASERFPRGGTELERVLGIAAQTSFRYVAALPAILLIVFGAIWLHDRWQGGYKPVRID